MPRIVVAAPDPQLRRAIRRHLDQSGLPPEAEASDGVGALKLIRRLRPDVAVLDSALTGLMVDVVAEKALAECPMLRVVVLADSPGITSSSRERGLTVLQRSRIRDLPTWLS